MSEVVYVLVGWFGDQEWIEGIYREERDANTELDRLAKTRSSPKGPEWTHGMQKYGVEEWELQ